MDRVRADAEDAHGFGWAHAIVGGASSPASAVLPAGRARACAWTCAGHRHRSCTCNTTGTNRFRLNIDPSDREADNAQTLLDRFSRKYNTRYDLIQEHAIRGDTSDSDDEENGINFFCYFGDFSCTIMLSNGGAKWGRC